MSFVSYKLLTDGSLINAFEMERADAFVVDVALFWGEGSERTLLAVKHLEGGDTLAIGEAEGGDFLIPYEDLGASRVHLLARTGDAVFLTPPAGASVKLDGQSRTDSRIELTLGHVAEVEFGRFMLRMSVVPASKRIAPFRLGAIVKDDGLRSVLGSACLHGLLLAAVFAFMPSLGADDADVYDDDRLALMQKLLSASAPRELAEEAIAVSGGETSTGSSGSKSPAAQGARGTVGKPNAATQGRWGAHGEARPENAPFARDQAKAMAASFGMNAVVSQLFQSDPMAPIVASSTSSPRRCSMRCRASR